MLDTSTVDCWPIQAIYFTLGNIYEVEFARFAEYFRYETISVLSTQRSWGLMCDYMYTLSIYTQ